MNQIKSYDNLKMSNYFDKKCWTILYNNILLSAIYILFTNNIISNIVLLLMIWSRKNIENYGLRILLSIIIIFYVLIFSSNINLFYILIFEMCKLLTILLPEIIRSLINIEKRNYVNETLISNLICLDHFNIFEIIKIYKLWLNNDDTKPLNENIYNHLNTLEKTPSGIIDDTMFLIFKNYILIINFPKFKFFLNKFKKTKKKCQICNNNNNIFYHPKCQHHICIYCSLSIMSNNNKCLLCNEYLS